MMFSRAVNSGNSWWNWNTKPMWRLRKSESFFCESWVTSTESMSTVPLSGRSRVPMICSSVVLPAPLGPTMLTTSPFPMVRSMPFSTSSFPKLFRIFFISIILNFLSLNTYLLSLNTYLLILNPANPPEYGVIDAALLLVLGRREGHALILGLAILVGEDNHQVLAREVLHQLVGQTVQCVLI